MVLHTIDWIIAAACLLICFLPALAFGKRSGKSTSEFFASGRSVPWWLAGISSGGDYLFKRHAESCRQHCADTRSRRQLAMVGVHLDRRIDRLLLRPVWRRSGVLTDLEFYELRYSGKSASAVRGFRAIYLGLLFNCMIMATVDLAACKIASVLFGLNRWETLARGGHC